MAQQRSAAGPNSLGRRGDVLEALRRAARPLTITDLADRLDVHVNTVRFHLDSLQAAGQVERVSSTPRAPGRPPLLFRAVPLMDPTGPRRYELLAEILAAALAAHPDPQARAEEAGREWGSRLGTTPGATGRRESSDAVGRLVALLDDLGFAPEGATSPRRGHAEIGLRSCPFLEVAQRTPSVACPLHLGMMRGAVEAWGARLRVDDLAPFVEPDRCLAKVSATR